jgi:hypothetical protein
MIVACIITYNDYPLIVSCVNSLIGKVDKIIAVDGKYKDFPGESFHSTDGTIEYLTGKVDLIYAGNIPEVDKRNVYLSQLADGDICLNLDSDEYLIGSIPPLNSDFGIIDLADGHSKHVQKRATRFFRYREGMRYKNVHYTLYHNDKQLNNLKTVLSKDLSFENIKDFYIKHNWHLRSELRKHYKSLYYKKLVRNEQGFPR